MTRYARAKGSKASNEREPEEATPWEEMVKTMKANVRNVEEDEDIADADHNVDDHDLQEVDEGSDGTADTPTDDSKVEDIVSKTDDKAEEKKKNKKCLVCKEKGHMKKDCPQLSEERRKELNELLQMKIERKGKGTGRKKNKRKNKDETEETEIPKQGSKVQKNKGIQEKKKVLKDKTGQVVNEGEALFQGFRVKKEDRKRLQKLAKDLKKKKVPDEELKQILKRERRTAEKELARSIKTVCYNCRKPGHLLNECPEKNGKEEDLVRSDHAGFCFKCGSLEHGSKECQSKLKGGDAYRFAVCFICKEKGHLAKACPDNPKGLYPNGGGCRFCGSVEHLKSECPRKVQKDAKDEIKVTTIGKRGIEEEEDDRPVVKKIKEKKPKKKVVMF